VEWAVERGIETATFHILTPYPGTELFRRLENEDRILHRNWDLYDTRHAVFRTRSMTAEALESGYRRAYRDFYRWGSILRGAATKRTPLVALRHLAYAGGWKKLEPFWNWVIKRRQVRRMIPLLETVLQGVRSAEAGAHRKSARPCLPAPFANESIDVAS
jgi:radical SAM superfamily enzyme YgiQ (UPF0313 family)